MPRYIVQRTFPDGLQIPMDGTSVESFRRVVDNNATLGVTWVHSYVSDDKMTTFCVYDAPDQDAIVAAAEFNGLPVDRITVVSVLDPYFYH